VSRPPRFDAIIFDMDGVLVDSEPMHAETAHEVLAPFGVAFDAADSARYFGFTDVEMFRDLVARHQLSVDIDELVRRRTELLVKRTWQDPRPMDGVPEVLHAIRGLGYRLALASSSGPEGIAATLDALDVRTLFDVVVSGLTLGRGKPAPDIFLVTARRLGLAPARCLVVEDSRNGLRAAKAAGMACAAVPCHSTRDEEFGEADHRLRTLRELLPILR
jgi:HAD superfamily hydrolase (TIGR01509 family)